MPAGLLAVPGGKSEKGNCREIRKKMRLDIEDIWM